MKRINYLGIVIVLALTVSSCGTQLMTQKEENSVAGYTLKSKKEIMALKILNIKSKKVLTTP